MNFTGREEILEQLEAMAEGQEYGQRRTALYGLGGLGYDLPDIS